MGGAAYRDIWAGVKGPGCPSCGRRAPGSNAAARIVECTPRRHAPGGAAGTRGADGSGHPCGRFRRVLRRRGGLIAVPLDPLLASLIVGPVLTAPLLASRAFRAAVD